MIWKVLKEIQRNGNVSKRNGIDVRGAFLLCEDVTRIRLEMNGYKRDERELAGADKIRLAIEKDRNCHEPRRVEKAQNRQEHNGEATDQIKIEPDCFEVEEYSFE